MPHVNIAIIDNRIEYAQEIQQAIEDKTDWPAKITTEIFTNADDLIDAFEKRGKFYDVIITDVFMPARDEDPTGDGTPQKGAIRIKDWLIKKRKESKDYRHIQLRWLSRYSDVSPFIHEHITLENYSWLDYRTHHGKRSFGFELERMVEVAIRNSNPGILDINMPRNFQFASPAMMAVVQKASQVAASDATILITGASGVGKERLAKYIHEKSSRTAKSWVAVNCAAFTEPLLESELFGHVKGAFTDARRDRKGLFEATNGGTLFLDEIGDMSLSMQAKLLRVLQEKEFRRMGEDYTNPARKSDFRLIGATNRNLHQEIAAGRFRDDLYYRIAVIELNIPPLKDRPEDISLLTKFFVREFAQKMNKGLINIAPEVMDMLNQYDWPGNVRELSNVIEHAVALLPELNGTIELGHLPRHFHPLDPTLELSPLTPEEQVVWEALKASGCIIAKAADMLNKSKQAVEQYIHRQSTKDGKWLHPTLRRLYLQEKAVINARTQFKTSAERAMLPPSPSTNIEEDF